LSLKVKKKPRVKQMGQLGRYLNTFLILTIFLFVIALGRAVCLKKSSRNPHINVCLSNWRNLPVCVIVPARLKFVQHEIQRIGFRNVQLLEIQRSGFGPNHDRYESHMKAAEKLMQCTSRLGLVFEYDVDVSPHFNTARLCHIFGELQCLDFDLCLLGTNSDLSDYPHSTDHILEPGHFHGFHAIAYNTQSLSRIVTFGRKTLLNSNCKDIEDEIPRNFNTRVCVPMQFAKIGGDSNASSRIDAAKTLNSYYLTAKLPSVDIVPVSMIAPARLFCFWTGDNNMSPARERCFHTLKVSELEVVLVTPKNLAEYIKTPLHPAYEYLSYTHRADYLRTYFMHHYGGGYTDIKTTTSSWRNALNGLNTDTYAYAAGYPEVFCASRNTHTCEQFENLIGNCAYIFKPYTQLTYEWLRVCESRLDIHMAALQNNPGRGAHDVYGTHGEYPLRWEEILGELFHDVCVQYLPSIRRNVPMPQTTDYR
jgi:hypothetical protein